MDLFDAIHVSKSYEGPGRLVRALTDVSLKIGSGCFLVLTGPSGSGKSTLLSLLAGLELPTSGEVRFLGQPMSDASESARSRLRQRMGIVFQDFALIPGLALWENVTLGLVPLGIARGERRRRGEAILAEVGLADRRDADATTLSGGEQQRTALARALVGQPQVILADEPTSNLDDAWAAQVVEILRAVHARGATVLVASHDHRFTPLATRQLRLEQGVNVQDSVRSSP